ncbi:threonine ammonia-lyase [Blastochloris viridis]|nr:threonine dehydratase [Blastochloris viridis]
MSASHRPRALPTAADVHDAAARLAGVAVRTPLLSFPVLDAAVGARVVVKPEMFQRTGAFKFRGAYNKIAQIAPERRSAGVVAWSSGNHAQGVAAAARLFAMPATIVMPADAPRAKIARTRAFGAEVVTYDRVRESREEIGSRLAAVRGATVVPPFDDADIIAGQGTVGLEIAEDCVERGLEPDVVVVPASGGGLIAGVALAIAERFAAARIVSAEPAGFDDHARSFASGRRESNDRLAGSICDALLMASPGEITFEITRRLVGEGVAVSDAEVETAMRFAFDELKLVVEPGGAVALAAVLAGRFRGAATIAVVMSGGNVDRDLYARILAGG